MRDLKQLITNKKWDLAPRIEAKLVSLLEKFHKNYLEQGTQLQDIVLYPGYFTTIVFKLVYSNNNSTKIYYAKLANMPKKWEEKSRERLMYEFQCTKGVHELFNGSDYCETVKAVAHFEEEAGFIMEEMTGKRLDELLIECMRPFSSASTDRLYQGMKSTGRWISEFQLKMPGSDKKRFERNELEQRISNYLKIVADETEGTLPYHLIDKLESKTQLCLDGFANQDFEIVAKHNDYAPWNMMLGKKGIIAFDFADCEFDSKFYDVYHFTRALNSFKLKPIKRDKIIENSKEAFLQGYGLDLPLNHPTRIYFNIYFSIERIQMLLRARMRNTGVVGKLKNVYQKRHLNWYLKELESMADR